MFKHHLAPLLCSVLALACQGPDDLQARSAELAAAPGLRVHITAAGDLGHDVVHAIAQHLEGSATDHGAAMVRLKKQDGEPDVLEIDLRGGTLPDGDVAAQLRAAFPALADATITAEALPPGEAPGLPVIAVDPDLSPAEAEQQIRDQLAADGVDGEVKVKVEDGPDGRRVEVGIEKQEILP